MSEIKFRAWDKEQKFLHSVQDLQFGNNGKTHVFLALGEDICSEGFTPEKFDLMQYTGLKDKNGKKIYEGDYLQAKTNQNGIHRYEVRRVKGGLAINVFNDEFQKEFWTGWNAVAGQQTSGFIEACCEVIGNKFEGME
jgi:uncharacterized phage protein (TIGR01671 family)